MADRPLLVFPQATIDIRTKRKLTPPTLIHPSKDDQVQKFNSKMNDLERVFQNKALRITPQIQGLIPEMVLVFEIGGTIDEFFKAVENTPGMEYLLEYQDEFLEGGSGFFYRNLDGEVIEQEIDKRIFATLTNERGIQELLSYWHSFKYGEEFHRGTSKFRNLFAQLSDIRTYNINDRLKDTGFESYINELKETGVDVAKFEIEFVFHPQPEQRNAIIHEINLQLRDVGGTVINQSITVIEEIKYFGAVAQAPITSFDDLSENTEIAFLQSQRVLFLKPVGQSISKEIDREGEDMTDPASTNFQQEYEQPIVALLDGMPLENHQRLDGKLVLDDPDGFSNNYLAEHRTHGTSMASLILYGDIDTPTTIRSRLYVRPILKLINNGFGFEEKVPDDRLIVDLIHRAIKRMFEGDEGMEPTAPEVKIINFSIGDEFRPFTRVLSTWAKLLDYASFKYKVLIIVSAGNYNDTITLRTTSAQFEQLTDEQKQSLFYQALFEKNFDRKILTPSETINGLTVGGLHIDGSLLPNRAGIFNPCVNNDLPCLFSRIGYGFNRSLKPELIHDAGRSIYRIVGSRPGEIDLRVVNGTTNYPPGIKIAIPGQAGALNSIGFSIGTSNATALISNRACKLYEVLDEINRLQAVNNGMNISKNYYAVLIKSLLIHYTDYNVLQEKLEQILQGIQGTNEKVIKEYIYQNIGYGVIDKTTLGISTDRKVTILGFGKLKKEEGHIYSFPLPNALSGKKIRKKLKISLGWLSPVNFNSGKYKMADLFFDNVKSTQSDLFLSRAGADFYISKRGTLQHDILSNDSADAYIQNSELKIKVSCREQASGLKTRKVKYEVEYGLVVTLENDSVDIYDEIQTRINQRIRVGARY